MPLARSPAPTIRIAGTDKGEDDFGASGSYSSDDFVLHYDGHGDLSCHSFSGEEEK